MSRGVKKEKAHMASADLKAVAQELVVHASFMNRDVAVIGSIRAIDLALLAVDYLCLVQQFRTE